MPGIPITSSAEPYNRRILIIDDNAAIHDDFRKVLSCADNSTSALAATEFAMFGESAASIVRPTFELEFALQGNAGAEHVRDALAAHRPFAVAFVDMRMGPGWDGLETIEHLWAIDPHIQVVICSAHSDYSWSDVTQRLGHSDKLLVVKKPFDAIEVMQCASALTQKWLNELALRGRVQSLEQAVSARTEGLSFANMQLQHLAERDVLTKLPNRSSLLATMQPAIDEFIASDCAGALLAVMLIDLDRFKIVNDSLGHGTGDAVLREVSERLRATVGAADVVARLGADEFLVLARAFDTRSVIQMAHKIVRRLSEIYNVDSVDLHLAASVGITTYPFDRSAPDVLISHADEAMYEAKHEGGNGFRFFMPGTTAFTKERLLLENDLRRAPQLGQLELHYQPQVEVTSGRIMGLEALARWTHPVHGRIPADEFIPLAEGSDLIVHIGWWILDAACRQARLWHDQGYVDLTVAVNFSARQFRQPNLLAMIKKTVAGNGLQPRHIVIELTESVVMSDAYRSTETLEELHRSGFQIAVDDFGTGYSSMSYLKRLPVAELKIDRSFIIDLGESAKSDSIVKAVISLAHGLGMIVVAEGVETAVQRSLLRDFGCDQFQGYLFSRPRPAAEIAELLAAAPIKDYIDDTHAEALIQSTM